MEARLWIEAILEDHDPIVLPEQAFVVTQILEGDLSFCSNRSHHRALTSLTVRKKISGRTAPASS